MTVTKEDVDRMIACPLAPSLSLAGVNFERIAKAIKEGMDYKAEYVDKETGTVIKVLNPAAMRIRQTATDSACKLLSAFPAEKHQVEHIGRATLIIEGLEDDDGDG